MASTTGIEVGPDSCILVSVRTGPAGIGDVRALHSISPADWRAHEDSRADLLRSIRKAERLPRGAAIVAWDLPADDPDGESAKAALRFVEDAGFRIQSILTPSQALARVAGMRRQPGCPEATVWTALNMHDDTFENVLRFQFMQEVPGRTTLMLMPSSGFSQADVIRIRKKLEAKLDGAITLSIEMVPSIRVSDVGKAIYVDQRLPISA